MADEAVNCVCKCERPICSSCQLPVRMGAEDKASIIAKIRGNLMSPEFTEAVPIDKLERALFFTLDTIDGLEATKEALERKDSRTSLLSSFFSDIKEDHKPLLCLVRFLNLRIENPDLSRRIQPYIEILQDSSDEDENLMTPIGCSSPAKSPGGEPVFPRFQFYHVQGNDVVSLSGNNT